MNVFNIICGVFISIGSVCSYIPQFYKIVKHKSVENISEPSLLIMNIGMMCLTMNSMIFNWKYFFCSNIECFSNLLPFGTIAISWLMVLIYYIIFITYKFKNLEKRLISGLSYIFTYIIFSLLVIALALGEKMKHNTNFFIIYANILGISSAVANGCVYIPQIYILLKNKSNGNISMLMYIFQTPGNILNIIFQIIYHAPISTWITYLICLIQQGIILILMIYFHYKNKIIENVINDEFEEEIEEEINNEF